jgi:hypothetical protein
MRLVEPDMAAAPAAAAESQLSMEVVSAFSMADDAAPAQCDEQARSDSASWQQCIDVLSENGETEMADRELTLFREAFPEHVPAN